jgi:hypothetical protein
MAVDSTILHHPVAVCFALHSFCPCASSVAVYSSSLYCLGLLGHLQVYKMVLHAVSYKANGTTADSFQSWNCTADMHVFSSAAFLVAFISCSRMWQFCMCSFLAADAPCLVDGRNNIRQRR